MSRSGDHENLPRVSVVVPVLNGESTIRACLTSLFRMDYPDARREVVLVDNDSTDRSAEAVKAFPVRYVLERRRGVAFARNAGIERSDGEVVAFTDADCVVTKSWLRELVAGLSEGASVGGVEGETLCYPPRTAIERYTARRNSHSYKARQSSPLAPFFGAANVAFRREIFERVGIFDTRFRAAEDIDFTWRFYEETPFKLVFRPKAVVFHQSRTDLRSFFRQQIRTGTALAVLQGKYPERLPWRVVDELRAWRQVLQLGWLVVVGAARYGARRDMETFLDAYYNFVRKGAIRMGYLRGRTTRALRGS